MLVNTFAACILAYTIGCLIYDYKLSIIPFDPCKYLHVASVYVVAAAKNVKQLIMHSSDTYYL